MYFFLVIASIALQFLGLAAGFVPWNHRRKRLAQATERNASILALVYIVMALAIKPV